MRNLDWTSACLFPVADPEWRTKIRTGGWFLLLPFVGWFAILGYRKAAVFRLIHGQLPILPDWNRGLLYYTKEGLKAAVVINTYYLPVYVILTCLIISRDASAEFPWLAFGVFFATLPIFSTLAFPIVVTYARFAVTTPVLSTAESIGLGISFAVLTFVIPSGFLNVSETGRILSAFNFRRGLTRIIRFWSRYLEAWVASLLVAAVGHGCPLFLPWGVVWSYLSIVFLFNEVPATTLANQRPEYLQGAWFDTFRHRYWHSFHTTRQSSLWKTYKINRDVHEACQLLPHAFCSITCGPIEVPMRTIDAESSEDSAHDVSSASGM